MRVLLIILLILFLIAIIPVGVLFEYSEDGIMLALKAAFLKIKLFPKEEKPKKPKEEKPKDEKPKEEKPKEEKKPAPKRGGLAELLEGVLPAVFDTLDRFRRKLTVNYLTIHYDSAAEDPYDAAMHFGNVSAALGAVLPALERKLRIKKRDIRTAVSFDGGGDRIYIDTSITIRIWEIIYVVCGLLPALKAFLKWQAGGKENKNGEESHK